MAAMKLSRLILTLGIILLPAFPLSAQEIEEAPSVRYSGAVSGVKGSAGLIETDTSSYLLKLGRKLGDYTVVTLNFQKAVLESPTGKQFPLLLGGPELGAAPAGSLKLRLNGVPLNHTAKAIADVSGVSVVLEGSLSNLVRYTGSANGPEDALKKVFPAGGPRSVMVELKGSSLWVVGGQRFCDSIPLALSSSSHRGKATTFDFVNAEFSYVMKVLARELGVELVMSEQVRSGVTIATVKALPAEDLVAILTAGNGLKYSLDSSTLKVSR